MISFCLFVFSPVFADSTIKTNYLKISLSPATVKVGQSFTVFVESANQLKSIHLRCFGSQQTIYKIWHKDHPHVYRAFLGVALGSKPGTYKIEAEAVDTDGESLSIHESLQVAKTIFGVQSIQLPKRKRSLLNAKQLQEEGKILGSKMEIRDNRVYFSSHFSLPVKSRISSTFGLRRQYNDGQFSSYHKGIDMANGKGTIVKAANGGKVSLVASMKSNGKIILINHGHGITSIYSHLGEFLVKEGEWVKKGQAIGKIGSTGISNGPHLHFGISVNDVRVDPQQWLNSQITLYYD